MIRTHGWEAGYVNITKYGISSSSVANEFCVRETIAFPVNSSAFDLNINVYKVAVITLCIVDMIDCIISNDL